jgi:hypothetical protein
VANRARVNGIRERYTLRFLGSLPASTIHGVDLTPKVQTSVGHLHRFFVFRGWNRQGRLRWQQPRFVVFEFIGHGAILKAEPHCRIALEPASKRQLQDPVPLAETDVLSDVLQLVP